MIDKITKYCTNFKAFIYEHSNSIYELLCKILEKQDEIIDEVNELEETVQSNYNDLNERKEDSVNITTNRKLSENGDFTGTWFGDTKSNVDQKITEGLNNYQSLIDYLIANPQIGWIIWDSKFFTTIEPADPLLDGGLFTEIDTEETDCGLFIYPCVCIL